MDSDSDSDSDSDTDTSSSEEEGNEPWEEAAYFYVDVGNHAVQVRGPGQMFEVNLGDGSGITSIHINNDVHLRAGAQVNGVRVNFQRGGFWPRPNRQGGVRQGRIQRREELRQRRGRLELCRRCGKIHRAGACTGSRPVAAVGEHHGRQRECPICLEAVGAAGGDDVVLLCGHAFHYACVAPWFRRRTTCPVCRTRLRQPD